MSEMATGDCGVCIGGGYDGNGLEEDSYYQRYVSIKRNCKCFECHETITAGTKHQQCGGTYEGKRENWRFCLICAEIADAFCCDGRWFGKLWESIDEDLFPQMTTGCLQKLTTSAAKEHLVAKWREWKFQELYT